MFELVCIYSCEYNREVVDMVISFELFDVEGVDFCGVDVVVYKVRKGCGRLGDIGLGKCFGVIRLFDNNNVWIGKDYKVLSIFVGLVGFYSEWVVLEWCVRVNWEFLFINIMIFGM